MRLGVMYDFIPYIKFKLNKSPSLMLQPPAQLHSIQGAAAIMAPLQLTPAFMARLSCCRHGVQGGVAEGPALKSLDFNRPSDPTGYPNGAERESNSEALKQMLRVTCVTTKSMRLGVMYDFIPYIKFKLNNYWDHRYCMPVNCKSNVINVCLCDSSLAIFLSVSDETPPLTQNVPEAEVAYIYTNFSASLL